MNPQQPSWRPEPSADTGPRPPRYDAQLEARLRVPQPTSAHEPLVAATQAPLDLTCQTCNLNESGLALIVPAAHVGGRSFAAPGCPLQLTLALPAAAVELHAETVRCVPLSPTDTDTGYLLGARITQMSDPDWVRLVQYLLSLR